jgi:hypothetical protein
LAAIDLEPTLTEPNMKSIDEIWHELDDLENNGADIDQSSKVRAGCTGELLHIGSIFLVGMRAGPRGGELIEFTCPQCGRNHESLLFS